MKISFADRIGPAYRTTFAALMIPVLTTGVKREPGAIPGLFLKL
jgi:hypothetical protein